jgi:lipopolysaccharide export system protein LptA
MKKLLACVVVLAVLVSMHGSPAAQQKDNSFLFLGSKGDSPVKVSAKRLSVGRTSGGWEFKWSEGVQVNRGKQKMSCEELTVIYDAKRSGSMPDQKMSAENIGDLKGIRSVVALGNVKIRAKDFVITAGKAVFNDKKRTIEFTDRPRMSQGANWLVADTIVAYPYEDRFEFDNARIEVKQESKTKEAS